MKRKDWSIETYRMLLMIGICALHAVGMASKHPTQPLANLFYWCVPGFVFISGWYGMKFSYRKIVKLYATALYAVIIASVIKNSMGEPFGLRDLLKMFRSFWFLNAYVALMFFAPVINASSAVGTWKSLLPLVFLAFAWGFFITIPKVSLFLPKPMGLDPYSVLMMVGAYSIGRMAKIMNWELWLMDHTKVVFLVLLVSVAMVVVGFCDYTSPFSMVIAIVVFFRCKKSRWAELIGKRLAWLGPSLFSVYLITSRNAFGLDLMNRFEDGLLMSGIPFSIVYLLTVVVVFTAGIALDAPRRLLIMGYRYAFSR